MILKEFANVLPGADLDTVAAAGSDETDAAEITERVTKVTGADAAKGVILPAAGDVGETFLIWNGANAVLLVYPPSGGTINNAAADAAYSLAANAVALVVRVSSTALALVA